MEMVLIDDEIKKRSPGRRAREGSYQESIVRLMVHLKRFLLRLLPAIS